MGKNQLADRNGLPAESRLLTLGFDVRVEPLSFTLLLSVVSGLDTQSRTALRHQHSLENIMRRTTFYRSALTLFLLLLCSTEILAQGAIPQRFSYQGVARAEDGTVLANARVVVRFSILTNSSLGNLVFQETHQASTNEFGLLTLAVGGGTPQVGRFTDIDWAGSPKFLRVEIDIDREGSFINLGTTQLLSVPYALASGKPADLSLADLEDVSLDQPRVGSSLVFDGTNWVPGQGANSLFTDTTLKGIGTEGAPIGLARQGAAFGEVLKWDGAAWTPGNDEGEDLVAGPGIEIINKEIRHGDHSGDVRGSSQLTVTGLWGRPVVATVPGNGQVLKYITGQGWTPSTDNSQVLFAGNGIQINAGIVSNDAWQVNNGNVFRGTGNVGIGTGNPQQKLQVAGAIQFSSALMPAGKSGLAGQLLVSDGAGKAPTWKNPKDAIAGTAWSTTGNANINVGTNFIGTTDGNPVLIKTAGAERIRVDATGNVGIGSTTPGTALEVGGGDVYVNSSANGVILKAPNGGCWRITVDNSGTLITTATTCP